MAQSFIRKSLELTPEQWRRLDSLAAELVAHAPTGPNAGHPSWRSLIKLLADGQLSIPDERHDNEPDELS